MKKKIKKSDLENLKKNHLKIIEGIAKDKTAWLNDFKEVYQENRKPKKEPLTVKDYAKNKT